MNNIDAKKLLHKYREGGCTPEEIAIVESWYLAIEEEDFALSFGELEQTKEKIWKNLPVHETIKGKQIKFWTTYRTLAAAAAIVLSFSLGLYIFTKNPNKVNQQEISQNAKSDILPGGKKAVLTLANGKSIVLNDVQNGKLAKETGSSIFKTANGEIIYNSEGSDNKEIVHNQLSIPRGGYYALTLADGTKVWLNSESTLKYPTTFVQNERVVELVGEGYFEVAHRKNQPFKVVTSQQTIEVLGTHFNINAYANEKATTTTLLQGSVKVQQLNTQANQQAIILKRGQQAILKKGEINVKEVDVEEAVAWVNNNFDFNNEELGSIMRKISRWYDVEVVCPPDLEKIAFFGKVSRAKDIKDVINIIDKTNEVHLKIEGRRITVMR